MNLKKKKKKGRGNERSKAIYSQLSLTEKDRGDRRGSGV